MRIEITDSSRADVAMKFGSITEVIEQQSSQAVNFFRARTGEEAYFSHPRCCRASCAFYVPVSPLLSVPHKCSRGVKIRLRPR